MGTSEKKSERRVSVRLTDADWKRLENIARAEKIMAPNTMARVLILRAMDIEEMANAG